MLYLIVPVCATGVVATDVAATFILRPTSLKNLQLSSTSLD